MATKISQLPAAVASVAADLFAMVQAGVTTKVTLSQVSTWALQTFAGFTQSGTGALPRTMQSKERDIISVKDYDAVGDGVADDTAALNSALAQVDRLVYLPAGVYNCASNLNPPTCAGIVGEGWNTGTLVSGSILKINGTVGLDLRNANCLILADFALLGTDTASSVGMLVGGSPDNAHLYTWDYGRVRNVRISEFTGATAIGLYLRDCNFGRWYGVSIDNCVTNMVCSSAVTAAGTVPADTVFYGLTLSSAKSTVIGPPDNTNPLLNIYSANKLIFHDTVLSGAEYAVVIDPALSISGLMTCDTKFYNTTMENIGVGFPTHQQILINPTHVNAACTVTIDEAIFETYQGEPVGSENPNFLLAKGAQTNVLLNNILRGGNGLPSVSNTSWILTGNGAKVFVSNWPFQTNVMDNASTDGTSYIFGPSVRSAFTPVVTASAGVITTATATGSYTVDGNLVTFSFAITVTTNGTGSGRLRITTPLTPITGDYGIAREDTAVGFSVTVIAAAAAGYLEMVKTATDAYPAGDGYHIVGSITYPYK